MANYLCTLFSKISDKVQLGILIKSIERISLTPLENTLDA